MREELATSIVPHAQFFVVLWLHTEVDPPADQWSGAIEQLVHARRQRGLSVDRLRSMVITDGGAPNAAQRAQTARDLHEGLPSKVAVLTLAMSNPVKRGVATALSWANPSIRLYQPKQLREALLYLDLVDERYAIELEYQRLHVRLNRLVRSFDLVNF
jgi:hypothetical protein